VTSTKGFPPLERLPTHPAPGGLAHWGRLFSTAFGLSPGMRVMGINGRPFSSRRLQDALADSVALRKIELLLLEGDRFRTIVLDYADGPRYLVLVRNESKPDLLAQILKPIADKPR
jgi:predicted metalloprotease with PDZ domain